VLKCLLDKKVLEVYYSLSLHLITLFIKFTLVNY